MSHSASDSNPNPSQSSQPLVSTRAGDPEMVELIAYFVEAIDDRVSTIEEAAQADDVGRLRTVAHKLKGSASGYGFEPIAETAGELERLIDATEASRVTEAIREQVDELISLCQRATV